MQHCLRSPVIAPSAPLCNPARCACGVASTTVQRPSQRWPCAELMPTPSHEGKRAASLCARAVDTKVAESKPDIPTTSEESPSSLEEEFYEVTLKKPLGFTLARGNDAAAYIQASDPKAGNTDERIQPGDKVVQVSASFGSEVWDCKNYGRVLYAIKTRSGDIYLKLQKRNGDLSIFDDADINMDQAKYWNERDGGNYGLSTKQWQAKNYQSKKEAQEKRVKLFEAALGKFRKGDIEAALIDFEEVISMEPKNFMGEDFSRVTQVYRVAQYNIACCYSSINQVDAGLEALRASLEAGFEGFGKIRSDPNLETLRKSPKFKPLVDKYDEPVISEGAIKAIKNLFSFGRK